MKHLSLDDIIEKIDAVQANVETRQHVQSNTEKQSDSMRAWLEEVPMSHELCDFMKVSRGTKMHRSDVTDRILKYIKNEKLADSEDPCCIIPDDELIKVVGTNEERRRFMEDKKAKLTKEADEDPTSEVKRYKANNCKVTGVLTFFNFQQYLNKHFDERYDIV